jgi:hypothetical protein
MQGKRSWVGVAVGLAILAAPAPAAAVTTIGSDLTATPVGGSACGFSLGSCTIANRVIPGRQVTSPFDGVIVRWRIRIGSTGATQAVNLRVLHGEDAATTGAGTGEAVIVPGTPGTYTFGARLPILSGERIGLNCCTNDLTYLGNATQSTYEEWRPALGEGESRAPTASFPNDGEVLLNADVEPDTDCDGFGDETQDSSIDPFGCDKSAPETTITKGPKDKTKRKQATFEFSSSEPGSSFECSTDGGAFAACTSPDTLKVKKGRHTFVVRAKDPAGNIDGSPATDQWKVKKKSKR